MCQQAHWSEYLSRFNLIRKLEPNLMHSLDDGMSIIKRGMATMPASIHRITDWYSLPSNWHHPSKLLPYQSQSSMDLSSWILKGCILTFSINSERIPFPQNTLTISQNHGPWTPMVYYRTMDASMFQILETSNSMFFNTHTTTPLQDISVRQRHSTKSTCTTIGLDFLTMSKTTENRVPLVPMQNLCAINLTDFSSNF